MRIGIACAAALWLASCARAIRREPADSLSGFTAPLSFAAGLRLVVDGSVNEGPADIVLDVASAITTVTRGCLSSESAGNGSARIRQVDGTMLDVSQVALPPARIGSRRIGTRLVAVVRGERRCVVSLGTDVLSAYAIQFDPERHSIGLADALPRSHYLEEAFPPTEEVRVVELARHPETDWPLLSARLRQGSAELTATFILSSRLQQSTLSEDGLRTSGFRTAEIEKSAAAELARRLGQELTRLIVDSFELAPDFGVHHLPVRIDSTWRNPAAVGLMGSDVWGRFRSTIDLQAGILVLRRPKVSTAGGRQLCASDNGAASEEACFVLHAARLGDSLSAVGVVWRDLPEGGRLYVDPIDRQGRPLQSLCEFGLSFPPSERGSSMRRDFPWPAVEKALPECAEVVRHADGFSLSLFEEGLPTDCHGQCAFVRRRAGRRVLCACASGANDG
jgi:hypothetical protein